MTRDRCASSLRCFAFSGAGFGQHNSGFLGSAYSKLSEVQSPSGQKARRWIAPTVTAENFQQVLLEKRCSVRSPEAPIRSA